MTRRDNFSNTLTTVAHTSETGAVASSAFTGTARYALVTCAFEADGTNDTLALIQGSDGGTFAGADLQNYEIHTQANGVAGNVSFWIDRGKIEKQWRVTLSNNSHNTTHVIVTEFYENPLDVNSDANVIEVP